ncbi:hypothetical protein ACRAWD_28305 [Caulobacter segnis]
MQARLFQALTGRQLDQPQLWRHGPGPGDQQGPGHPRMGGTIGVESRLGEGARFWIALTAEPSDATPRAAGRGRGASTPAVARAAPGAAG